MITSLVGYYERPFDKLSTSIPLPNILERIKGGFYRSLVEPCRTLYSSRLFEEYVLFKKKLPAVTFCGTFSPSRTAENLGQYTQLIIFDVDDIGDTQIFTVKQGLETDPYIVALWLSPSGNGIKFLIRTEEDSLKHKEIYNSAVKYFTEKYQLAIDKSGSDLSRLCFVSYDPDLYLNLEALSYNKIIEIEKDTKLISSLAPDEVIPSSFHAIASNDLNKDKQTFRKLYHYLQKRNLSITDTYEKWVKVAFALRNTFPYNIGNKYFLELCRLDFDRHDEIASNKLIYSCYKYGISKSNFGTIIFLAKEKGYIPNFDSSKKVSL
jgi:hypothetical protein